MLRAAPDANVGADQARQFVGRVVEGYARLVPRLEQEAALRAEVLLQGHRRVREGARVTGVRHAVEPKLPVDVLGIYVFLPAG